MRRIDGSISAGGSQNVNAATPADVTFSSLDSGSDDDMSLSSNKLVVSGSPKVCDIHMNLHLSGAAVRGQPAFKITRDGTDISPWIDHTYIRNNTGHDTSSANATVVDKTPGDDPEYGVRFQRQSSNSSTITCDEGSLHVSAYFDQPELEFN